MGNDIKRLSRWIEIKHNYNPSKRNSLWDYVTDGYGYHPYDDRFNPDENDGLFLDYFTWNGSTWALDQFLALGSVWWGGAPIEYTENGEIHYISGVDGDNYFNPIYIEFDEYCEHVRVYECR